MTTIHEVLTDLQVLHSAVVLDRNTHSVDTLLGLTDAIRAIEVHTEGKGVTTIITPIIDNHTHQELDPIQLEDILKELQGKMLSVPTNETVAILSGIHAIELYLYDEALTNIIAEMEFED